MAVARVVDRVAVARLSQTFIGKASALEILAVKSWRESPEKKIERARASQHTQLSTPPAFLSFFLLPLCALQICFCKRRVVHQPRRIPLSLLE